MKASSSDKCSGIGVRRRLLVCQAEHALTGYVAEGKLPLRSKHGPSSTIPSSDTLNHCSATTVCKLRSEGRIGTGPRVWAS